MNNLRLTIIMFILAAALAPIALVGFGNAARETVREPAPSPAVEAAAFAPAGLKRAPWEGVGGVGGSGRPPVAARTPEPKPAARAGEPFALVELFTSEGCSSCPPADALLSEIAAPGPASRRLVCVAYHVDYWDDLGWKDPFAGAAYTQRQREYAKLLKDERVYTPQAVVNGRVGLVGSDRRKMTEEIDRAMAATPGLDLTAVLDQPFTPGKSVAVSVRVKAIGAGPLPAGARVMAAVTEDGLVSRVTRGENEGRELRHDAVCRVLVEGRLDAGGAASLKIEVPAAVKAEKARVAVWVQGADGAVLAAAYAAAPAGAKLVAP